MKDKSSVKQSASLANWQLRFTSPHLDMTSYLHNLDVCRTHLSESRGLKITIPLQWWGCFRWGDRAQAVRWSWFLKTFYQAFWRNCFHSLQSSCNVSIDIKLARQPTIVDLTTKKLSCQFVSIPLSCPFKSREKNLTGYKIVLHSMVKFKAQSFTPFSAVPLLLDTL